MEIFIGGAAYQIGSQHTQIPDQSTCIFLSPSSPRFDLAKTMQRAISDTSSATEKISQKSQQINKRTRRVMRAKISLFKKSLATDLP